MNVIISNPIISKFLSNYPTEKHTNCLLGIILFGIYNLEALSIDFSKILLQVEASQKRPSSSFLSRVQNSVKDEAGDTPRFISEPNTEKNLFSLNKLKSNEKKIPHKPVVIKPHGHMKTPSIVNPEIISEYANVEHSEVLRIADQFLNGQFVNEYYRFEQKEGGKKARLAESVKKEKEDRAEGAYGEDKKARSNSTISLSGRRNSYCNISANRSIRGDRSTSYSKFW